MIGQRIKEIVTGTIGAFRHWRCRQQQLTRRERNLLLLYAQVFCQGIAIGGAMAFISVFLVRLGAPNWVVGAYTSLPALVMTLVALPAGGFVQRQVSLVRTAAWSRLIFRSVVGMLSLVPFLPAGMAPYAVLVARGFISLPGSVHSVSMTTLLGRITRPQDRMSFLSRRRAIRQMLSAAMGFIAGQWLSLVRFPLNYQLLFLTAAIAGLGTYLALTHIELEPEDEPSQEQDEEVEQPQAPQKPQPGIREMLGIVRDRPIFARYIMAMFLFRMGTRLPQGLYPIFRVRTLGSTDAWIGIILTVRRTLLTAVYFAMGHLLRKEEHRRWLWVTMFGLALHPATTALARNPTMLLIPAAIGGLFAGGANVSLSSTLMRVSPDGERALYASMNTFVAQITRFVGPMLGTLLASLLGIRVALYVAAGVRVVGALAFWWLNVANRGAASESEDATI